MSIYRHILPQLSLLFTHGGVTYSSILFYLTTASAGLDTSLELSSSSIWFPSSRRWRSSSLAWPFRWIGDLDLERVRLLSCRSACPLAMFRPATPISWPSLLVEEVVDVVLDVVLLLSLSLSSLVESMGVGCGCWGGCCLACSSQAELGVGATAEGGEAAAAAAAAGPAVAEHVRKRWVRRTGIKGTSYKFSWFFKLLKTSHTLILTW